MSNKENPVDSSIWRHLPSDKTLREFRREYQQTTNREKEPSVTWVKDSLNQISEDNPIVENLFRNYAEVVGHHNTYPVLIPLETAELLSTILETRDSNKKAKGEAFAAEILSNLAEHIVTSLDRDISGDYVYLQYLSNENIRDKMMQKFKAQLLTRLDLLRDYIIDPEAGMDIGLLQVALGRLDVLISIFDEKRPRLTSDTCALMDVYGNLIAKREETIPAKVRERGVNYYNWCKDKNVDSDLISEMKQQINRTRRDLDKCDLSSFINNYRKYLIQQFPDSVKKDNLAFWEAYKEAYSYFMQEDSAEQFEQKIRKELTAFAINIFEDLENADTLELEYTGFVKTNAASSFAEYMLAGIHRDILVIIHKPLWILKVVNSYRYFLNNTDMHPGAKVFLQSTVASFLDKRPEYSHEKECQDYLVSVFKKIDAITNQIQKCYQELSIKYPELESDGFKDDYLKACKIFRDVKKDYLLLIAEKNEIGGILCEKDSLSPDKHYKKLFAASNILRIACKYVVAVEIEKAVPQLVERYCELRRRIKE